MFTLMEVEFSWSANIYCYGTQYSVTTKLDPAAMLLIFASEFFSSRRSAGAFCWGILLEATALTEASHFDVFGIGFVEKINR